MGKYTRTSQRKLISDEILAQAKQRIQNGESKRQVARDLSVNESSLRKRLKAVRSQKVLLIQAGI